MKRALVTDTHLGLYNDSDLWLDIVFNFFKEIVKYCYSNNINQLIHLGDFFDNRKSLNTKTQHIAHRIAKILEINKELQTYIIVGNHDCYYKNQIHPNTLELFKEYKHIHVIDEITKLDDILLVPWGEVPEATRGAKYCFGHFAIDGFHMNDSAICKGGIDRIKFKDFDKVLSGHFHSPSNNKNITYLGSPYGQTFNDAFGVRGFHIFDDGKLDFIEYINAPKFIKIYTTSEVLNPDEIKGNIVRIVFTKDFGTNQNQTIIDNIIKHEPLLYSVDFANMDSDKSVDDYEEYVEMETKEKIAEKFINEQTFPANVNIITLKTMYNKIMKEALNSKNIINASSGAKIQCDEIGFQNFLSFGSKWQDVKLHDGVNFVVGFDKDKGKSNGAGKSSFLETIPFALFGKTAREINQNQIINWKNKKNCLVVFRFKINNDLYEIKRGLKPNILEIYKNGTLMDQDAHKSDYQSMFENIFGMDIKMFMNIIHSNVNNSGSVLSMKKADKRVFLEKMFDLEVYSSMNKICNEKIRRVSEKKYKIETDISSFNERIKSCNDLKKQFSLEITKNKESIETVVELKEDLDKLLENDPNIENDIKKIENDINEKKDKFNLIVMKFEKSIASEKGRLESIENSIKKIENQEDQRLKNVRIKTEIKKIIDKVGDFKEITEEVKKLQLEVDKNKKEHKKLREELLSFNKKLVEFKTNLKNIEKNIVLLSNGICPVCRQNVDDPKKHYEEEREFYIKKIECLNIELNDKKEKDHEINKLIEDTEKKMITLNDLKDKIVNLKSQIKDVASEEEKEELLKSKKDILESINNKHENFKVKKQKYDNEISALSNKNADLHVISSNIKNKQREYEIAAFKAEEIKKSIDSYISMIKEQDEKIENFEKNTEKSKNSIIKLNELTDYINSIKFILKDENIKQHTIQTIMPFLNKQTNHYLSEVNYGFYVVIDKWLDVEIKGPGIRNATYESLSGGERRGIDISLQLALLDIARMQSGIFPDILVFDELLDSSIDSRGINELMKIVRFKQKEVGGKIFVISHRDEIDNEIVDNQYKVIKENGYSKVII